MIAIRIESIPFLNCRTALAEAELEYDEKHKSTAVYVQFPLIDIPDVIKTHMGMFCLNLAIKNNKNKLSKYYQDTE